MSHTKGPWHRRVMYFDSIQIVHGSNGNQEPLAEVYQGHPEAESNARLIAAAPDLFEALQRINANGYSTIEDHDMILAAIAKATGNE